MFSNTVSRPDPALNPSNDPSCHVFTEELRTFIRACKCFVHAIGFYSPQFRFLAKKKNKKQHSSLLTIWKACKNMTQSVNANAAPHSSWETDAPVPSASSTSSPSISHGGQVLLNWFSVSHQGEGGTELCRFNFGFTTLHFQMISLTGTSCLYGRTFLSRFCVMPPEKSSRNYWKWTTWQEGHKAWILFLALQYDFTSYSAYRCISWNRCI